MISLLDQSKILAGIFGAPFFIFTSFFILFAYVLLWFRKRQTLTKAISIFEVPLIMSCSSVGFSLLHYSGRMLLKPVSENSKDEKFIYFFNLIFYISTYLLTLANNLLLPLLFIYSIFFFIKNTEFRLVMFIIAISYTNLKFVIYLKLLPNFIQFNLISIMDSSKCLIVNPIDLSMLLLTLMFIFFRLHFSTDKLSFEDSVVIFEVVLLTTLKIFGMMSDIISTGLLQRYPQHIVQFSGINTETMFMKNYEFTQMIIPYLFIFCGLIIRLEDLRKKATVNLTEAIDNGTCRWIKKRRPHNTVNNSDGTGIRAPEDMPATTAS
ncbi:hypothetical protein GCK72_020030 [Caenorhabditis remanei]|uniref:Uncharacterized protein n=1 Tax=Caenorhabditis remanei TaxID=31234 RepID=A0A6A5GFM9_CAERE|nr:hypothetical protein GCK72_020030 [Caenorhabditis remanei]KAF1753473.1 hypothetical protein GCK72_020030 [Caenorhabditis remanei]